VAEPHRDLPEHIRELAVEYGQAAARLKEDARLCSTAQAAPILAAASAYQGCADRLGIVLAAYDAERSPLGERLAANHASVTAELAEALAQQQAERLVALTTYTITLDGYGNAHIAYNGQGWTFSCDRCEVSGLHLATAGEAEATARYHLKQEHTEEADGG
jgi:hypothetical protein